MNHDIHHCNGVITPGNLCTRREDCQRYIAHLDAKKHKLEYLSYTPAYCCVHDSYIISGETYAKMPYSEFKEKHESRSSTAAKPLHKSTRKPRTSSSKSKAN